MNPVIQSVYTTDIILKKSHMSKQFKSSQVPQWSTLEHLNSLHSHILLNLVNTKYTKQILC